MCENVLNGENGDNKTFSKEKSVLISLISDTSSIRGPYIKLIFGTWRQNRGLLRLLHASTWYCSVSRNGAFLFGKTCFVKRNAYLANMSLILINFRDVSDILMSSFVSVLCILFSALGMWFVLDVYLFCSLNLTCRASLGLFHKTSLPNKPGLFQLV